VLEEDSDPGEVWGRSQRQRRVPGGSADEARRFKHDGDQHANFGVFEVFQEIARTIRLLPGDDG
jgi:hypothetical protein